MSLRIEFVALAEQPGACITQLCRRFGISRTTAYKWLGRARAREPLADRSRRPLSNPMRTAPALEDRVIALRQQYPYWGGRKLAKVLERQGEERLAPSTVTHILHRHGLMAAPVVPPSRPWQRFEHAAPNDLWQMDFKGPVWAGSHRCDPLTVLDDHSRFNLVLANNADMAGATVQRWLTIAFQRYGLPWRMNMDNGTPWGIGNGPSRHLSTFAIWLVQLGIHLSFSRPFHPQTNGKEERFHRSLDVEVLRHGCFSNLDELGSALNQWRTLYNHVRPHEALGMETPAQRYRVSQRAFPDHLPAIEYGPDDILIRVDQRGRTRLLNHPIIVSTALNGRYIAARPRPKDDGVYDLYFSHHRLDTVDLRDTR